MTPARMIKTTIVPMAITPDVSPMDSGSTVAVGSISCGVEEGSIGVGEESIGVEVVPVEAKTIPDRSGLEKIKPKINTIRKKLIIIRFIGRFKYNMSKI